ncbi:UNKNOWN [Stylonychia lemnae]|uniref:Uncharacterized protein n=1 Tax=Stylonychia lemnae TaxID=5949 RepID=A0A077ZRU2_STYLE|nr:UNKNOWN [Stylonychia lemnae]|eukprot:CDW72633.1 UNKNOWN [Stylonychia lemnae]
MEKITERLLQQNSLKMPQVLLVSYKNNQRKYQRTPKRSIQKCSHYYINTNSRPTWYRRDYCAPIFIFAPSNTAADLNQNLLDLSIAQEFRFVPRFNGVY